MTPFVLVLLTATSLPNFDQFGSETTRRDPPRLSAAAKQRIGIGYASQLEPRLGVPSFYWAARGDLPVRLREQGVSAEQAARRYLYDRAALYRFLGSDLAQATAFRTFDLGTGGVVVSFRRLIDGVPLYRDAMHVVMTHDYELVALSGWLNPFPASARAGDKHAEPFSLSQGTALAVAFQDVSHGWLDPASVDFSPPGLDGWTRLRTSSSAVGEARARRVWYGLSDRLVAAWQLEWESRRTDGSVELYTHVVSAEDGRLLTRLTMHDEANQFRVWADPAAPFAPFDGPEGNDLTPNPTGTLTGVQAPTVASALVSVDQAFGSDPWLAPAATDLVGNNVEAYADAVAPDGYQPNPDGGLGDERGLSSSAGVFDYSYDFNSDVGVSVAQHRASATAAFFTANWAHDWLYGAGFNETAGNAQSDNFGRGGSGTDSVRVEVHDWANFNTTSAFVPADGQRPKLELYPYIAGGPSFVYVNDAGTVAGPALFGPQSFQVTAPVVRGYDVDGGYGGCYVLADPYGATGKIVLYDRALCGFYTAAANAFDAGAAGVLITYSGDQVVQMGGPLDFFNVPPSQLMSHDAGSLLALQLDAGLAPTVSMSRLNLPERDSALDATLVVHEYGHVMSNRLIGDANGLINTVGLGMGEGWSDFLALMALARASDAQVASNMNWKGTFAIGSFAAAGVNWDGSGNTAYYLGVRRYPYSTNTAKNGLSFRHIQRNETLPLVPGAPFGNNEEPHSVGEVWAETLWDGYAAMLNSPRHSFADASTLTLKYLVGGISATASTPTFLDGRDAMLAFIEASDQQDFALWLGAFAGRGMGIGARAPDHFAVDNIPVTEDMSVTGAGLRLIDVTLDDSPFYCDHDGFLDDGETGTLTVTVLNTGITTLSNTTLDLSSTFNGVSFPDGAHLTVPPLTEFHSTTVTARVALTGATDVAHLTLSITAADPAFNGGTQKTSYNFLANVDSAPSFTEKAEASASSWHWNFQSTQEAGIEYGWSTQELAAYDPAFVTPDVPFGVDSSLESPLFSVTGHLIITFQHAWSLETFNGNAYDGGLLEISTDGGATWVTLAPSTMSVPYNGSIYSNANSPIAGSAAFIGDSPGYPGWVDETIDLGMGYVGMNVLFRFRLVTDISGASKQWAFDNFGLQGVAGAPFRTWVKDGAVCVERPPRVNAGPDAMVDEGAIFTLQGTAMDPDLGDTFSTLWTQTGGPTVLLSDPTSLTPTFTAPMVAAATPITFKLTGTDLLQLTASDEVVVTVNQVNHKPVATATTKAAVKSGDVVTLAGSGTDPDGDRVTFKWSQLTGPTVTLSDATVASPTFTAPKLDNKDTLSFQLVVNDGRLDSDAAMVSLEVDPKASGCGCGEGGGLGLFALLLLGRLLTAARRFGPVRR